MEMINDDPLFLDNIVFSDEVTFELKCIYITVDIGAILTLTG